MSEKISNYELQCRQWQQRFLQMDHEALHQKLPFLEMDRDSIRLWHFGRYIAVSRTSGEMTCLTDGGPVPLNLRLNIFTLFWYSRPGAALTGRWVPFRELKGAAVFDPAFQKGTLEPFAADFSGKTGRLREAAGKLRGTELGKDRYLFHAFECMPVQLLLWDGDEDFPARVNLLFDSGAVDFIHVESMVTVAGELFSQLSAVKGGE